VKEEENTTWIISTFIQGNQRLLSEIIATQDKSARFGAILTTIYRSQFDIDETKRTNAHVSLSI